MILSCSPEAVDITEESNSELVSSIYYISNSGNNDNDGLSLETAWLDVTPVNAMNVPSNTTFVFDGSFDGLLFDDMDQGATITSYDGRASLKGIHILNSSNYIIKHVDVKEDGITIENTLSNNTKISNFEIKDVEVSEAWIGILIQSYNDTSGITDVNINNVEIHDCTEGGIYSKGYFNKNKVGYSHSNINIYNSEVYNISGWDNPYSHTGNGIMLSDVQNSVIEYSTAYNSGQLNANSNAIEPAEGLYFVLEVNK